MGSTVPVRTRTSAADAEHEPGRPPPGVSQPGPDQDGHRHRGGNDGRAREGGAAEKGVVGLVGGELGGLTGSDQPVDGDHGQTGQRRPTAQGGKKTEPPVSEQGEDHDDDRGDGGDLDDADERLAKGGVGLDARDRGRPGTEQAGREQGHSGHRADEEGGTRDQTDHIAGMAVTGTCPERRLGGGRVNGRNDRRAIVHGALGHCRTTSPSPPPRGAATPELYGPRGSLRQPAYSRPSAI